MNLLEIVDLKSGNIVSNKMDATVLYHNYANKGREMWKELSQQDRSSFSYREAFQYWLEKNLRFDKLG